MFCTVQLHKKPFALKIFNVSEKFARIAWLCRVLCGEYPVERWNTAAARRQTAAERGVALEEKAGGRAGPSGRIILVEFCSILEPFTSIIWGLKPL